MKATHIGTTKDFKTLLNNWSNQDISVREARSLFDQAGKELEFNFTGYSYHAIGFDMVAFYEEDLTDIQEIKPKVEIPEGDFWIETKKLKLTAKLHPNNNGHVDVIKASAGWIQYVFKYRDVQEKLNNGTWKLCDEPEKKTRPFTDEELEEFIYSDGWITKDEWRCNIKIIDIYYKDGELEYLGTKSRKVLKAELIEYYRDRHGNKFEKEA